MNLRLFTNMNIYVPGKIFWVVLFLFLVGGPFLLPQNRQQETEELTEYVEVVNVELIVRALLDGKPVGDLKTSDFILLENGKELPITSLTEIRRKIGETQVEPEPGPVNEKKGITPGKKRFFLLYFWISERELKYRDALDYFFEKVYRDGDDVLMVVKNRAFKITRGEEIAPARLELEKAVEKTSVDSQADTRFAIRQVGGLFDDYLRELWRIRPDIDKLKMIRRQTEFNLNASWQEFQYKHLVSNGNQLAALADELMNMDAEKWSLVFYQENVFPHFDFHKVSHRLDREGLEHETGKMKKLIATFKLKTKLPNFSFFNLEKIKQAFINGETTFHVLWMNSKNRLNIESRVFDMENVYAGWLETFKGISRVTGGEVINANKLKESLEKIVEREDIYYRLTYAPAEAQNAKRKIEVKVKTPGVIVTHLTGIRLKKSA